MGQILKGPSRIRRTYALEFAPIRIEAGESGALFARPTIRFTPVRLDFKTCVARNWWRRLFRLRPGGRFFKQREAISLVTGFSLASGWKLEADLDSRAFNGLGATVRDIIPELSPGETCYIAIHNPGETAIEVAAILLGECD